MGIVTYKAKHTRFFPDILEDVINGMSRQINVTSVVDNNDGSFTLSVCDVKYLQKGFTQFIDEVSYTIDDVDHENNEITVIGSAEPPTGIFNAYAYRFYHGTVIQTNNELNRILNVSEKTPMIYLMESFSEEFNRDKNMAHERVSDVRLFFLTQANYEDWVTSDYYAQSLRAMRNLLDLFILTLDSDANFNRLYSYRTISRTRFGLENTEKGYQLNYFGDNLAGIEALFSFKVARDMSCLINCE